MGNSMVPDQLALEVIKLSMLISTEHNMMIFQLFIKTILLSKYIFFVIKHLDVTLLINTKMATLIAILTFSYSFEYDHTQLSMKNDLLLGPSSSLSKKDIFSLIRQGLIILFFLTKRVYLNTIDL